MKKLVFSVLLVLTMHFRVHAQLSGTLSVPGTYTSIAAAIADLNTQGVNGATTLQISANYTETVPTGGFTLTATGTAANPIIFQKTGTGANPLLIAYSGGVGTPTTAIQDGIWRFIGSDYITIDGIDLQDQNTSNPATMEFGFCFFKASATNGCRNNTIKNCAISLQRINVLPTVAPASGGSKGIEVVNAFVNSHTLQVSVSAGSGANSNNLFFSNTIQNCNIGIALSGCPASPPSANFDTGNVAGGTSAANGNTITSFGAGTYSNTGEGISASYQQSITVAYNSISSTTVGQMSLFGFRTSYCFDVSALNNTISIAARSIYGIYLEYGGGNYMNVSNNAIVNCSNGNLSGVFTGVYMYSGPLLATVNNNLVSGITYSAASGFVSGFDISESSGQSCTVSIASNTISNFANVTTNSTIYGINFDSYQNTTFTIQSNFLSNLTRANATFGNMYGIFTSGSSAIVPVQFSSINSNTITGLNNGIANINSTTAGIYYSTSFNTLQYLLSNVVSNITGGTGDTYGLYYTSGSSGGRINNNKVNSLTGNGNITGINCTNGISMQYISNEVGALSSQGSSSVCGIKGLNSSGDFKGNKIYDISSNGAGSAYVKGLWVQSNNNYIINNMIGDLRAPNSDYADAVIGLDVVGGGGTTNYTQIFYNTVRIDAVSSTGLYFGAKALSYAGVNAFFLRNNILINLAQPTGGSSAIAFDFQNTSLNTYTTVSDNNLFYAGSPSSTHLIFTSNTASVQTLTAFKALVAPREAASVTENTPFISTVGTSTNFLHVSPPSLAESGATNITLINNDFDGDIRQGNTGYIGTGTAPDIGADEFGTPACSTVSASAIAASSTSICAGQTVALAPTAAQAAMLSGIQQQWRLSASAGGPSTLIATASPTNLAYASPTLAPGNYYYTFSTGCSASSQTATSNEVTVSVYPYPTPAITPSVPVICTGTSGSISIAAAGAANYSWSPATDLSSSTGSQVIASPATTSTYIVTGINPGACTGSTSIVVAVFPSPTVAAVGNSVVCAGSSVNMSASGANTYSWSNGATQTTITPIVSATTVFSVVGTSTAGNCKSSAQVTITVNPTPSLTVTGGTVLCEGQTATLAVSGANTYTWSTGANTTSIIVSPLVSLSYNVIGSFSTTGCSSTGQQVVTVLPLPVVSISGPASACAGASINLTANGAFTYSWSNGASSAGITISPNSAGTYSVIGTSLLGCSGTAIKTITIDPLPSASITSTAPSIICEGESIELLATSDIATIFDWSTGASTSSIVVSPPSSTIISVVVKNSATNCTNTAQYSISTDVCSGISGIAEKQDLLLQPNPFQQHFQIIWNGAEESLLEIYNSTGSLIMTDVIKPGETTVNMEAFSKGLYYAKIGTSVLKIVNN